MSSSTKKKAPRKFLCVGGPWHDKWKTHDQLCNMPHYYQYNNAGRGMLSAVFVWLTVE